jgi:[ribosomal protein S5]-alanine N-acetyltransferase
MDNLKSFEIILENEEIYLRTWVASDAQSLFDLNNDEDVMKYTGDKKFDSLGEAVEFVNGYSDFKINNCGRWMIIRKNDSKILGWCGIKYKPNFKEYDLGFRLFKSEWNKGYASQASLMALQYAKNNLKIKEIYAHAVVENYTSIRVLQKLNFTKIGNFKEDNLDWNKYSLYLCNEL